jgi:hypothetical protein
MPAAIRLRGFFGELPALSASYLPDQNAQIARNTRLWRESLRPVNGLRAVVPITTASTPQAIYRYSNSSWFEWTEDVDVVRSPVPNDQYGRVYFTRASDGPWVTASAIATTGSPPFPGANRYRIGVPAPTVAPTVALGTATGITGTFYYVYTVVNQWGEEGPPSPVSAMVNATDDKVNITLTAVGAGSYAPVSAYRIYRTNTLGTAFQFVAQVAGTTYTDANTVLVEELPSTEWDAPPTDLRGFIMLPNGVIAAFRGNEIRLSEPGLAHAWPADYSYQTDFPIVALAPIDNGFAALTSGEPYLFIGTHPAAMAPAKLENSYACLAKRGVARFGNSAVYPSANGLAYVSASGVQLLTEQVYDEQDWAAVRPNTLKAFNWRGRYVGFYTDQDEQLQGLIFDPASPERGVGRFYGLDFGAAYEDLGTADVYVSSPTHIALWDGGAPQSLLWRSKRYELPVARAMTVLQVWAESYPVTVSVYRDGQLQDRVRVATNLPHRVRNSRLGRIYEIEIEADDEVHEVVLGASSKDLRQT